ncbi:acyl-CoA/acyl-ACP dehydrogenase [Nocardia sp. NBC_01503]|uniref:acyl-CoA dehydrogenase family protein n=1 Tax=Nocardia sp. NBC_01503 TaxID=2975997 RepID=UPI002E7BA1D6|nr:acyl-CoA dehydrogenase family protein [Nocardia sp. NBC_01503]WTL34295.1 acyl-CoA/acyl-ACP dehydrogenase [Nocardia sp. NBC_01503]
MDFAHSEAQHDLSGLTRDLLIGWSARNPCPDSTGFDRALWRAAAAAGLLDAALPNTVGGSGFDVLEQCSILIEIGRAVAPLPYLPTIAVCAATLAHFGTEAQLQRWVAPALRGETTLAPALGSETGIRAIRIENGWCISGSRGVVPAGSFADAFLVEASTDSGSLLAMVDRTADGLEIREQRVVDASDTALLVFDNVSIPDDAIIGATPGDVDAHPSESAATVQSPVRWAHRRSVIASCAHQLGVLERAVEMTAAYARDRHQFGKPIGSFQAVRQRLADAHIDVDAIRLALWQAAWLESEGHPCAPELEVAAFWSAEAGHRVAHTAVHIHASTGIYLDFPLHRHFTAAKRNEFTTGGATPHLRALGNLLADAPAWEHY